MKKHLLVCLFSLIAINLSVAQNKLSFISATTGAACYEVCYYNNYLYAGAGNTLLVYNVSTGSPPYIKLFEYRFTSNIDNIQIYKGNMYISANHAGLSKWNLTNPAQPQLVAKYVPSSLTEAAYDVAFYGDTIFAAFKTKVAVFKDNGTSLQLITNIAAQTGNTRIRGVAVKGNLLAFAVAYSPGNAVDGVYLYNTKTLTQLSYNQQTYCDPEDVVFGQNTNLMHVLGGTQSYASLGLDPSGLFYSLDITNPSVPVEVYRDTLPGIYFLAVAQPMNAEIRNDTIYVATQSALDMNYKSGDPLTGHTYIYDCSNPSNIHLLNSVYGGLWHFDAAIDNKKMHIASEWYGIKTLDINDIYNEVDLGNTRTGGWNLGSDKYGNKLVVAQEGFGFKLYDITNLSSPTLINSKIDTGFCFKTRFSKNGNYIFGLYYTGDDFRVFNPNTLSLVASIQLGTGLTNDYPKAYVSNDKVAVFQKSGLTLTLYLINVMNPLSPVVEKSIVLNNMTDIFANKTGKLFVSTKDSLSVLDLNNNLQKLATIPPPSNTFNDFTSVTEYKDTVYAYITGLGGGLAKYHFTGTQLVQIGTLTALPVANPKHMAADSFALYVSYHENGLYAFKKSAIVQSGYYMHGSEFVFSNQWGPQDLYCKDNLLFLVEYMGQTSIFSGDDNFPLSINDTNNRLSTIFRVYPNPSDGTFTIFSDQRSQGFRTISIFNIQGQLVYKKDLDPAETTIKIPEVRNGLYLAELQSPLGKQVTKLVIER